MQDPPAPESSAVPEVAAAENVAQEATPEASLPDLASGPEAQEPAAREDASEPASTPLSSASLATSGEGAVIANLKSSLLMASEFESRLRDLSSQAEVMKTNMHVSTYVSSLTHWV